MKKEEGLIVSLRISPNASKNEIIKTDDGVKIKITAPPVDGKEFLSKLFKIPKSSIEFLRGETSKEKTLLLKIDDDDKIAMIKSYLT